MDSTLILGLFIGMLGFTFAGIKSEAKMFSIFAIGPAWVLMVEFKDVMFMSVILAGFMVFSVYYAMWGGYND